MAARPRVSEKVAPDRLENQCLALAGAHLVDHIRRTERSACGRRRLPYYLVLEGMFLNHEVLLLEIFDEVAVCDRIPHCKASLGHQRGNLVIELIRRVSLLAEMSGVHRAHVWLEVVCCGKGLAINLVRQPTGRVPGEALFVA